MKELCSFLCLLLVLPGSMTQCTFRDESLFDGTFDMKESTTGNDYGIFQHHQPLYVWENHRVHFTFDRSLSQKEKRDVGNVLFPVMFHYQRETCMKFYYHRNSRSIPEHHLLIKATFQNRNCGYSGRVGTSRWNKQMVMELKLNSDKRCERYMKELIYHEMGHAMGIGHTHKRPDRDTYVKYRKECVKQDRSTLAQFAKITGLHTKLPYECNSIMHYNQNTFNKDDCWGSNCRCNVLSPQPGTSCKAIRPSHVPTKLDWELINMGQKCP